jgi:hypothetical protein
VSTSEVLLTSSDNDWEQGQGQIHRYKQVLLTSSDNDWEQGQISLSIPTIPRKATKENKKYNRDRITNK